MRRAAGRRLSRADVWVWSAVREFLRRTEQHTCDQRDKMTGQRKKSVEKESENKRLGCALLFPAFVLPT